MKKITLAQILADAHAERMQKADNAIKTRWNETEAEKEAYDKAIKSINELLNKVSPK